VITRALRNGDPMSSLPATKPVKGELNHQIIDSISCENYSFIPHIFVRCNKTEFIFDQ
jgi:hypothetical protein